MPGASTTPHARICGTIIHRPRSRKSRRLIARPGIWIGVIYMPKGPPPGWRQRKQPIMDEHVKLSMSYPMTEETGHYGEITIADITGMEKAVETRRGLFN